MKECSFCGAKIIDETKPCPGCGYNSIPSSEILGDAKEIDSQLIEEKSNEGTVDAQHKILPMWIKIVLVIATLLFSPIIGIICGILLLFNQSSDYKRFGKKLVIIALIYLIVTSVIGFIGVMSVLNEITMY